jgi:trimeric autotransporter adhesin
MRTTSVIAMSLAVGLLAVPATLAGPPCTPEWSNAPGSPGVASGYVGDMVAWDDGLGGGPQLYATGSFAQIGGAANTALIGKWNGSAWSPLGTGLLNQFSSALEVFNGQLYVGGYFDSAGGAAGSAKLARWTGSAWSGVNAQLEPFDDSVWALKTFNDGSGEALYVGGNYTGIGGTAANFLARFDGTNYTPVGSGPIAGAGIPLIVFDIESWDDGGGPALYIGGRFTSVAGVPANRIAKWDGTQWSALGSGITGTSTAGTSVNAIEAWDDGSGPSLFVAGQSITNAGGVTVSRIARWDGTQWHDVGGGLTGVVVWDLRVFDDGSGEALYAVGNVTMAGSTVVNRIARWDGKTWSAVGGGVADQTVFCALPFDDGSGEALFIGGSFTNVDGLPAAGVARYNGCPTQGVPGDTNGDGVVDVDDLVAVILGWGACPVPPADCPADVNGSGEVDVDDLVMVILNWG